MKQFELPSKKRKEKGEQLQDILGAVLLVIACYVALMVCYVAG